MHATRAIRRAALAAMLAAAGTTTFAGCSSAKPAADSHGATKGSSAALAAEPATSDPAALTRVAAITRSKQVMHPAYDLWFRVNADDDEFEGRVTANFDLRRHAKEAGPVLALDFEGGTLTKTELNGTLVTVTRDDHALPPTQAPAAGTALYNGHQLFFPVGDLRVGPNRIAVTFTHPYNRSSHGLHRFRDPADGETYLYTDFEPYFAHQVFPCFDQPDLKARFGLTVEAPKAWTVISNVMEREVTGVSGLNSWTFPRTPSLSTYLFAMHMGPFASWKSTARIFRKALPDDGDSAATADAPKDKTAAKDDDEEEDDDSPAADEGLPIRLFARKSIAQYVDAAEWLKITAEGLRFYSDLFDYPFPYGKYDQVLLPEFSSEAMENAGAVAVSDDWVSRSKDTEEHRMARANLILHEAAHHWFGDLVTLKWWNGLWLNESFAELMAAWSVEDATQFKGSWRAFNVEKQDAYEADQLVTTHAVDSHVPDTEHAFANFDDITYDKGAAVLRQLIYLIGEDQFKDGIQRYFAKYAGRNTTISEFIHSLSEASAKDLRAWQENWLQTPGLNTVRADWACEVPTGRSANAQPRISKFTLIQGNAEMNNVLRTHRMEIALLKSPAAKPGDQDLIQVNYGPAAETPVLQAVGRPCPSMIVLNHGDYDYVKVLPDSVTLATVRDHLSQIADPLTRQMFWFSLWSMVEDGSIRAQDFTDIALKHLPSESDTTVVHRVLDELVDPAGARPSALKFLDDQERAEYRTKLETFTRENMIASHGGSDRQLVWFDAYLDALHSPEQATWARRLLDGKAHVHGLKIDQERRWALVEALARTGAPDAEDLISQELQKDPTAAGKRAAIGAEVSLPEAAVKKKWLARVVDFLEKKSPMPLSTTTPNAAPEATPQPIGPPELREAMQSFHWIGQEPLSLDEADAFFSEIPKLGSDKSGNSNPAASSSGATDTDFLSMFADSMYPSSVCQKSIIDRATQVLGANPALPAPVVKSLKINRQQTERCLRARERSAGAV